MPENTLLRTLRSAKRPVMVAVVVAAMLVAGTVPAAGADGTPSPSFEVVLAEDGSAVVSITVVYEFETADDRDAFTGLENDASAREDIRNRFEKRIASVADASATETGREMSVSDSSADVYTVDGADVGVVEFSVAWDGFAAVEDDQLVVTEPFASGFDANRKVTVVAPEGYRLVDAEPSAAEVAYGEATWAAETSLEGFDATFEESDGGIASVAQPGFGALAAIGAVLVVVFAGRFRR